MRKSFYTNCGGLLIVTLVMAVSITHGQTYFFRHYQVENGLSNSMVYCSAQDQNGFMWFGTKDGLNRFDGYHFKVFNTPEDGGTVIPDAISSVFIDSNQVLWAGCEKGLYRFDPLRERLVRSIDSLRDISNILSDKRGRLWFRSGRDVCWYEPASRKVRRFPANRYFEATALGSSEDGEIWAGTQDGNLQHFNRASGDFTGFSMFSHSLPAPSNAIQTIYPGENGTLYVGTSNQGIKQFMTATGKYTDLLALNSDKTTIFVRDVKRYSGTEFWFATESGIFILNTNTKTFTNLRKKFLDPYSLSDNAVYTLCKDREGGIWAGTYFGGINYYSHQFAAFEKYFPDNSRTAISGSVVREICEDGNGHLWIGTEDAGLNRLDPKTGEITQFKPTGESSSIAYTNIHGLLVAGNELWIGTFEHGLDVMDIRSQKIVRHFTAGPGTTELKSNFIVSLLKTHDGTIYAGSSNSLFRYNPVAQNFDPVVETEQHIFVACLFETRDHTIWVGTQHRGLFYFNPATGKTGHFENQPGNRNSISTNTINAIFEDSGGTMWFATEGGGLCKLDRAKNYFTTFTTNERLPSNFTFKVLEDRHKMLWVSTSRGLVQFNPANADVNIYTKDNGLLNNQFNYNSGYRNADGKMYFGSVKGMVAFYPEDLSKDSKVPTVFITGLQVQNRELAIGGDSSYLERSILYTQELTLPYDHASLSIDLAAPSYISPEMTVYSYMLKGLENEWTEIKPNRKIYFSSLAPGKYVLHVKAAVDGKWTAQERQLTIRIVPPFWATTWAYLLYGLLALGLFYYLLSSYHIILEDRKEKEIYEAKINFFTNVAHEIRTPLTLIKGPVENLQEKVDELPEIREDVEMMERNTNRLITLVTQILDFRKAETKGFSMDFTRVNINSLLGEAYLSFSVMARKRHLDYTIECPPVDVFAMADEEALNKIFSNLLNNALKYAHERVEVRLLPPQSDAGVLKIEFENDGTKIPAEMREKIFEPFYRLKEFMKQEGTGIGLALAKSLTELHNGDLYLRDSPGDVNIFVLALPLRNGDRKAREKKM